MNTERQLFLTDDRGNRFPIVDDDRSCQQ